MTAKACKVMPICPNFLQYPFGLRCETNRLYTGEVLKARYHGRKLNSVRTTIASAVFVFALTACSSTSAPTPDISVDPAASSSAAPTTAATPAENDRGQIVKEVGETATFQTDNDEPTMKFKVTSIKPVECDAPYATPPKGTALAVSLEIETTAAFDGPLSVNGQDGLISFSPRDWKGYASNGTRMNTVDTSIQQSCLADTTKLLPDFFGKGEKLNGLVILDVTTPTGEISFDPSGFGGWIWKYPSA